MKNLKNILATSLVVLTMTVATTFANGGILVAGAQAPSNPCAESRDGILVAGRDGILVAGRDGILVAGFAGILVAGLTGILVAGAADSPSQESCGILVAG